MPRFRNTGTGVVVNVSDDTAAGLDKRVWEPADKAPAVVKKAPAPKRAPAVRKSTSK